MVSNTKNIVQPFDEIECNPDSASSRSEGDIEAETVNTGWANSIAKVLSTSKPQKRKTLVLSRAKKFTSTNVSESKPEYGFEIEQKVEEDKNVKTPVLENKITSTFKKSKNEKLVLRNKPSIKDFETEKALKKIATKGVVQLFNAIRIQQRDLNNQIKDAGRLDHKKDAVLENINKRKFLDVLMSGERSKSIPIAKKEEQESDEDDDRSITKRKSEWSVLRDDFITNKKLKNWDEEESDDQSEKNEESESTD